jgi:Ca2+-binding EF-hand superfamily protein
MIAIFDEEYVAWVSSFFWEGSLRYHSGGGTVDFQEFVGGLSAFSSRGGREEKLRCSSAILY